MKNFFFDLPCEIQNYIYILRWKIKFDLLVREIDKYIKYKICQNYSEPSAISYLSRYGVTLTICKNKGEYIETNFHISYLCYLCKHVYRFPSINESYSNHIRKFQKKYIVKNILCIV